MSIQKKLVEILKNMPMKNLKEPIEHWYDDGKACDVQTKEIDYDQAIEKIMKLVEEKK